MSRAGRILVCGHACLDLITRLPRVPGPDEKVEALDHWLGGGGPAANAAVALRRLGHEVELLAARADDAAGRLLRAEMEAEGVGWRTIPADGGISSIAQIRAVGGERSIAWRRGDLPSLRLGPDEAGRWLEGRDLLYIDGHEVEAARVLAAVARREGVPVVADLGSLRRGMEDTLECLSWAAASPRFLQALSGSTDPRTGVTALARRLRPAVPAAVTLGERGCLVLSEGRWLHVPARRVDVVDATAAGDAFHAGLADALLTGLDPPAAVRWASTLAAAVCRDLGGRRGLPRDRAEAERWHGTWPERKDA